METPGVCRQGPKSPALLPGLFYSKPQGNSLWFCLPKLEVEWSYVFFTLASISFYGNADIAFHKHLSNKVVQFRITEFSCSVLSDSLRPYGLQHTRLPCGSAVKNPSAMQETWIWSLGQEDALEEDMVPHFSILAWRILWTGEPGSLYSP